MKRRLNVSGVWVILNEKDKRIWLGTGNNCETLIKAKQSLCYNYKKGITQKLFDNVPVEIQKDIVKKKGDVIDKIYLITYDLEAIEQEVHTSYEWIKYRTISLPPIIKESLRHVSTCKLFKGYEPYSSYYTVEHCENVYNRNRAFIYEMVKKGHIRLYQANNLSYSIGEFDYDWEEKGMINSQYQYEIMDLCEKVLNDSLETPENKEYVSEVTTEPLEAKELIEKKELISTVKVEQLLTIEALLRDTTVEALVEDIVSDKAKRIAKLFK